MRHILRIKRIVSWNLVLFCFILFLFCDVEGDERLIGEDSTVPYNDGRVRKDEENLKIENGYDGREKY